MVNERALATVELVGALAYGQLRAFEVAARAVRHAPDADTADRLAAFAVREHEAYAALRRHLAGLTDLPAAVMERQKPRFDDYFDEAPVGDWLPACTFFAVGLPIAGDFIREIAPTLPAETAVIVVGALADRRPFEDFALEQVTTMTAHDEDARQEVRRLVADVLGRALTGFQGAIGETDALRVLLETGVEGGPAGEGLVKRVAMRVLEGHRRRMHALGLEDLEEKF